jgi:prepilin-type N-terminal cleavage/methylation domain-containing protein
MRPAFTLIETLLTLCVLAILAALAWPAMERPLAGHRLQKAADMVRAEWTTARVDALESGQSYRFLYLPGGNRYRVERSDDSDSNGSGNSQQGSTTQQNSSTQQNSTSSSMGIASPEAQREATLPDGVTFQLDQTAVTPDDDGNPSQSGNTSSSSNPPAASSSGSTSANDAGWSDPLWFNPDGTTSTARLVLKNTYNYTVQLSLRGFTGVASVGSVLAAGEKP